jgi:hypothetical protein
MTAFEQSTSVLNYQQYSLKINQGGRVARLTRGIRKASEDLCLSWT